MKSMSPSQNKRKNLKTKSMSISKKKQMLLKMKSMPPSQKKRMLLKMKSMSRSPDKRKRFGNNGRKDSRDKPRRKRVLSSHEKMLRKQEDAEKLKTEDYYIGLQKHHDDYREYKKEQRKQLEGLDRDKLVDQKMVCCIDWY